MTEAMGKGLGLQPSPLMDGDADSGAETHINGKVLDVLPVQPGSTKNEDVEEQSLYSLPVQIQRAKSDDEVVRAVYQHQPLSSSRSRPKALNIAASQPETVMLGFLWMLYLSWLASAGL